MPYGTYTNGNTTVVNSGAFIRGKSATVPGVTTFPSNVRLSANSRRAYIPYSIRLRCSAATAGTTAYLYLTSAGSVDGNGDPEVEWFGAFIGQETPIVSTTPADLTFIPLDSNSTPTYIYATDQYLIVDVEYRDLSAIPVNGYFATSAASSSFDNTYYTNSSGVTSKVTDGFYYVMQYIQSPSAPTISSITSPVTSGQEPRITVTWTAPTDDGGAPIEGYDIYFQKESVPLTTVGGATLSYTFLASEWPDFFNGTYGTRIGFKVRAYNSLNIAVSNHEGDAWFDGTDSAISYVTVQSYPTAPLALMSLPSPVASGAFSLQIGTPYFIGGSNITGYTVSAQEYDTKTFGTAIGSPVVSNPSVTTTTARTNLITNPSFGAGTAGWTGSANDSFSFGPFTFLSGPLEAPLLSSHGGMGSASVDTSASATTCGVTTTSFITVSASTSYTALAYFVYNPDDPSTATTVTLTINGFTSADAAAGSTSATITLRPDSTAQYQWHPILVTHAMSSTAVKAKVSLSTSGGFGPNYLIVDNFLLERTDTFNNYGGRYFDGHGTQATTSNLSIGDFRTWPAASPLPEGWLWCDGSYVSIETYIDLYNVIGTMYGTNVGSTFRLPSLNAGTVKYIINTNNWFGDPWDSTKYAASWSGTVNASTSIAQIANTTVSLTGLNPRAWYLILVTPKNTFTTTSGLFGEDGIAPGYTAGLPTAVNSFAVTASTSTTGSNILSWTLPADHVALNTNEYTPGAQILSYKIYDENDSLLRTVSVTNLLATNYSSEFTGLNNGDNYTYYVVPVNVLGNGTASAEETEIAPGPSPAPTSVVATPDTRAAGRITLTWSPPATGLDTLTGYRVKYVDDGTTYYYQLKNVTKFVTDFVTLGEAETFELYTSNTYTDNDTLYEWDTLVYRATVSSTPSSTSTVPLSTPLEITNTTNTAFSGEHVITDTTATSIFYASPVSGAISEANIVSGFGGVTNLTNTSLTEDNPYVISTTGPDATTFSYTIADTVAITPNTVVPRGIAHSVTDEAFNGERIVATEPNVGASTLRLSIDTTSDEFAAREAGGTVENLSIAGFNTVTEVTAITEDTISYKARENLLSNSSFDTVATGTTTVRTNFVTNPSFEVDTTGWSVIGTGATIIRSTVDKYVGSASLNFSAASDVNNIARITVAVPPSQTYTASAWVKGEAGKEYRIILSEFSNVGGLTDTTFPDTTVATGEWERIKVTAPTFAANAAEARIGIQNISSGPHNIYIDAVMIEASPTMRDYFDGSTTDALGWDYGWSGTANASTSTAKASVVTVNTNLITNPSFEVDTAGWVTSGGTMSRVTTQSYSGSASLSIVASSPDSGAGINLIPVSSSTNYTFSAWVKGEVGKNVYLRIREFTSEDSLVGQTNGTPVVCNGSWQRVSVTRSFGATGTVAHVFIYNGDASASHTFFADAVQLEAASAASNYFDGSTAASSDFTYAWIGTANASTSIQRLVSLPNWVAAGTGNRTVGYATSQSYLGSSSMAIICGGDQTLQGAYTPLGNRPTVTPNMTYTASAWVKGEAGKTMRIELGSFIAGASVPIGSARTVGTTVTATGNWQRLSVTKLMEPTAVEADIVIRNVAAVAHTLYVDAVMIEAASVVQDYVEGSTADVVETESAGTIYDLTNQDIFNGSYTVTSVPTHNTLTYVPVTTSTTNIDEEILYPYGAVKSEESPAEVEVKFRSGWIG